MKKIRITKNLIFKKMKLSTKFWAGLFLALSVFVYAQDNEACEDCHADEDLEYTKFGITHSLFVTSEHLGETPHEGFDCTECHQDLDGFEDFPHNERLDLPNCGECHDDVQAEYVEGFYKPLIEKGYSNIPQCSDCHGKHQIKWQGQPREVCGVCHNEKVDDFLHSAHWHEATGTADVTCVSCHSPHNKHERLQYSPQEWKLHLAETCRNCHKENVENYFLSGHYEQVKSGNLKAPICSNCHAKHKVLSPRDSNSLVSEEKLDLVCINCHQGYQESVHTPTEQEDSRMVTCVACHTGHETEMKGTTKTSIFDIGLDKVCLKCHRENIITSEQDAHGRIHRDEIAKIDNGEASNCGDCHTYHFMAPDHSNDTALEKSCADCHEKEQAAYEKSSHFIAREKGHEEAPACITCHDNRRIQKAEEEFFGQSEIELCARCHDDREITMRFQLNPHVLEGYNTSYHGQMYQLGYQGEEFATCVSCHDNHSILPSDHPESTIGQQKIIATCGQCHEEVNLNFVQYLEHYTPMMEEQNPVLHIIHIFMVWLLIGTLTIFGGHTILWLIRLLIKRATEGPIKKPTKSVKRVKRFNLFERILHFFMAGGFLTLAATGLPLKYSHSEMANWVAHNIVGFHAAALLHRFAAIILGVVFAAHLGVVFYKMLIKRQKGILWGADSLVPNWQDVKDFFAHMAYFLGARKKEPKFGRWTYWEKFDYLAVFWGMLVIGASGITLWFPENFSRLFPGWLINAAHIIHSEEALLATAFIFVVHFFNTHLRPGAFPMDEVIFTGRVTEERFEEERPLEMEAQSREEYESRLINPLNKWLKRLLFLVGYLFLFFGLFLLVLIIVGTLTH
ncbi:MAG: cytochrome c3 family protein [Candidatus Marinimicrobia bacterium]|nr:cytochrome c3 family protein [Candidatus Neomarinimicrobiota bacterium]